MRRRKQKKRGDKKIKPTRGMKRADKLRVKGKVSWFDPDRLVKKPLLQELIKTRKYVKGKVLDLGCGDKPYEKIFLENCTEYIGVDQHSDRADVKCDILNLEFADESFDTVISTQVIEHVKDPLWMLQEANRVLKPEGYAIISAPLTCGLHEEPHDYYRFTEYGLRYLAKEAGFGVVRVNAIGTGKQVIAQKIARRVYGDPHNFLSKVARLTLCGFVQAPFSRVKNNGKEKDVFGYVMVMKKK